MVNQYRWIWIWIHICMHTYAYAHIRTYLCAYVQTHTHRHTLRGAWKAPWAHLLFAHTSCVCQAPRPQHSTLLHPYRLPSVMAASPCKFPSSRESGGRDERRRPRPQGTRRPEVMAGIKPILRLQELRRDRVWYLQDSRLRRPLFALLIMRVTRIFTGNFPPINSITH